MVEICSCPLPVLHLPSISLSKYSSEFKPRKDAAVFESVQQQQEDEPSSASNSEKEIIAVRRFFTNFPGKETIRKLKDCSIYNYNTLIYRWFRMSLTLLELGRNATLIESKSH